MSDDHDFGLEVLFAVKADLGADVEDELLQACFEIQKKYQFNQDRTLSTQAMDSLIEHRVEKVSGNQTEDGA
jgi:hypothetical protein